MVTGGRAQGFVGLRVLELPGFPTNGEREVGTVGTVVSYINEPRYTVVVRWDNDDEVEYSYKGSQEQYGLLILDSGTIGTQHGDTAIQCQACAIVIGGARWKCSHPDCACGFDLCSPCYHSLKDSAILRHPTPHNFIRYDFPHSEGVHVGNRRLDQDKVMSRGVFADALVRRGKDWCWDEQDGGFGGTGKVIQVIKDWLPNGRFVRGSVEVLWKRTGRNERYRFGFSGKTEVIGVNLTNGGYVYPAHLPKLGTNGFCAPRLINLRISMTKFYDVPTVAAVSQRIATLHIAEPPGTAVAAAIAAVVSETPHLSPQQQQASGSTPSGRTV